MSFSERSSINTSYQPVVVAVEPDDEIRNLMQITLQEYGFRVIAETNPTSALEHLNSSNIDAYIVDMAMPDIDGISFVQLVNSLQPEAVVVIFTFQDDYETHLRAIEVGADDFLSRNTPPPLAIERLRNCINKVRRWSVRRSTITLGKVEIDFEKHEIRRDGQVVPTTVKELSILRLLAEFQGAPASRDVILSRVWKYDVVPTTRTVDNFILSIRKKIEPDPANPKYLLTASGVGYKFILPTPET